MGASAARPADRRGVFAAVSLVPVARLGGSALRAPLWFIFGLGALQGAVGWWMVASGLADRVEVSQYRLATHLVLACVIYVALIWTAQRLHQRRDLPAPPAQEDQGGRAPALHRHRSPLLVLAQIYLGALVAGLRAGYIYNTWPLIDGAFCRAPRRCFRYAAVAEFFRKCADRSVRSPHARLCDLYPSAVARA